MSGYGYDEVKCKDVEQETCYNVPRLSPVSVPAQLSWPVTRDQCQDQPLSVTRIRCEQVVSEKCILVPEVEQVEEREEVCRTELGEPECRNETLELPRESCIELVYGYAHGFDK